jgi:hypothetical protein
MDDVQNAEHRVGGAAERRERHDSEGRPRVQAQALEVIGVRGQLELDRVVVQWFQVAAWIRIVGAAIRGLCGVSYHEVIESTAAVPCQIRNSKVPPLGAILGARLDLR